MRARARLQSEHNRAPAATRLWLSSNLRLDDNIAEYRLYDDALKQCFASDFLLVKRIVKTDVKTAHKPVKIRFRQLCELVYRSKLGVPGFESLMEIDGDFGKTIVEAMTQTQMTRAECFKQLLTAKDFYNIGPCDEEGYVLTFFKVIWIVPPRAKWVMKGESVPWLRVSIHYFHAWNPDGPEVQDNYNVYGDPEGPALRDLMKLTSWEVLRRTLRHWQTAKSDVAGCVALGNARLAFDLVAECFPLHAPECPILLIFEELSRRGWTCSKAGESPAPLLSPHVGVFSATMLGSRCKAYFQCLLFLGELFAKGLQKLVHSEKAAYYASVLVSKKPGEVAIGCKTSVYQKILLREGRSELSVDGSVILRDAGLVGSGDEASGDGLDEVVGPPRPKKRRLKAKARSCLVASESDTHGDEGSDQDSHHETSGHDEGVDAPDSVQSSSSDSDGPSTGSESSGSVSSGVSVEDRAFPEVVEIEAIDSDWRCSIMLPGPRARMSDT